MTMDKEGDSVAPKPRKQKSREVSSRFLSPSSTSSLVDAATPSLNQALSPVRRKTVSSANTRKHRSLEDSGLARGLWPSLSPSATSSSSSSLPSSSNSKLDTLADHLGNERLQDLLERKDTERSLKNGASLFYRQRSCSEFNRFEDEKESLKENHRPSIGGSMRYTGKFRFPGKSSSSSSSSSSKYSSPSSSVVPGRSSVDEKALSRKAFQRKFDSFSDGLDSESDRSNDFGSSVSSRKSGIEVSSKYLNDASTKPRRWPSDSNININPASTDNNSPRLKKFTIQNAIKRANSLTGYGRAASQWALSPGRAGSQPMTVENKGIPMSFSSLKPPTSPSRTKGVGNFLSLGLELFKSKKSSPSTGSSLAGNTETVHQFRLLHNRLLQWRFVNARADSVNQNITNQTQSNLIYALDSLTQLQHSVVQKKLQLARENLEMKLNFILHSQIRPLEAWGDMERQHLSAVSVTKDCLNSVVCRVPLIEGAEVNSQSASLALCHALDLAASIKSMLATFSSSVCSSLLYKLLSVNRHL
ncbi:hypothetical protein VitviT2T_017895 [Vitis vinifera]|uniref:QWRF motif-containing protein 3 n=1 Tax=Vitis vinifera TaxID=29760 RepID=A0ABY9CWE5_VITVI|nr:hypothetical protein VitviT2T_017895 [Vitis vinifera]